MDYNTIKVFETTISYSSTTHSTYKGFTGSWTYKYTTRMNNRGSTLTSTTWFYQTQYHTLYMYYSKDVGYSGANTTNGYASNNGFNLSKISFTHWFTNQYNIGGVIDFGMGNANPKGQAMSIAGYAQTVQNGTSTSTYNTIYG